MNKDAIIKQLGDALTSASEHLDYVGYGDSWESDCAESAGLPQKIETALDEYEKYCEEQS